ncbi:MAG TPA: TonB-dependent receptor plug domain-containing protein, partial [Geobacteraceae bacterium]|nr:TonB-dependent receptor plug domain-containing protein [Geobacteraceae bacterium]
MKIVIAAFAALCLAGTALSAQAAGQLREEEQEGIGVTGKRAQVDTEKPAQTTTTSSAHQSEVKKMELDEIKVRDTRENAFVETKGTQPYTESTITKEGIKIIGGPGQSSVIKVLDVLPSVNVESFDPYGLNRQGRFLRIRGQGAMSIDYSLEGIPVDAGAGARTQENAFDMENFSGVTLYKGASPVDQGFGWGNSGGTVNMSILKPLDKAGLTVSQSAGSFNFFRTFVRADTGEILPHLKSFLSYSYTETDKWKGEGGVDRNHVTFDTVFSPSSMVNAQLNFDYNTSDSHSYRSLSYAQSKDLRTNYEYDFNKRITGVAKEDIYYYDFNKVNDDYLLLFGNVRIQPADNHTVTIKPYFS